MKTNRVRLLVAAMAFGLMSSVGLAADPPIYGSQLMTNQERIEHRAKLRAAKTAQEREQIRLEHHTQMQERARERGVTLPDMPPAQGAGMGRNMPPGGGMGGGMGPGGGGMGPGGRGR